MRSRRSPRMGAAIQKHKRGFLTHSSGWHCETVPSPPVPAGTQRSGSPRPAAAAGRIGLRAPVSPHSVHAGSSGQLPGTDLRVLLLPGAAFPVGRLFPARSGSSCRAGLQGWAAGLAQLQPWSLVVRQTRAGSAQLSTAPRCCFLGSHEPDAVVYCKPRVGSEQHSSLDSNSSYPG